MLLKTAVFIFAVFGTVSCAPYHYCHTPQARAVVLPDLLSGMDYQFTGHDIEIADKVSRRTLNSNNHEVSSRWNNQKTGNSGTVYALPTYQALDGSTCREIQQSATVGVHTSRSIGTACRNRVGQWEIYGNHYPPAYEPVKPQRSYHPLHGYYGY